MSKTAKRLHSIKEHVGKVIVGLEDTVETMIVSILSGGHVLLEGPPGLGKTTLANTFARSIGGSFGRVQMTPDMLPSDILGVNVYNPFDSTWVLRRGPIFANARALKSVKVYHSNEDSGVFHVFYDIEKRENVTAMSKEFKNHPVGKTLLPRFYSLIVENSHRERYFDLIDSIGRHRFSSLPSKNIPIYQIN